MSIQFEWNTEKAATNLRKHGVSFDEASTVFGDPLAVIFDDLEHSTDETRELIIGHSVLQRLLLVFFHGTWQGSLANYQRKKGNETRAKRS